MPPENAVQDCCSPDIFIPVRLNERHDFFSPGIFVPVCPNKRYDLFSRDIDLPERFPNCTLVIIADVFAGQKAFGPV